MNVKRDGHIHSHYCPHGSNDSFESYIKKAIEEGADIENLLKISARERIGRFKYIKEDKANKEYENILEDIATQINDAVSLEEGDL